MPALLVQMLSDILIIRISYKGAIQNMPDLVKLRSRAQVTLPKEAVKILNLKEGDNLPVEVANGKVIITPVAVIPRDELWARAPKMCSVIEQSRLEARKGNLEEYDSVEDLWEDLLVAEGENGTFEMEIERGYTMGSCMIEKNELLLSAGSFADSMAISDGVITDSEGNRFVKQ
jgi:antitoxin MazE